MKTTLPSLKNIFLFSIFFSLTTVFAQVPQKMSYQAVIRNASNNLVANTPVGIRISVLQGSIVGPSVYTETQNVTTNINGLVTFEMGAGTPTLGTFSTIPWASGSNYFIKTETDPTGGANYTIFGNSQLLSVPYALSSADNRWTTNGTNITNNNTGNVGVGTNNPLDKLSVVTASPLLASFDGGTNAALSIKENGENRVKIGSYYGNPEDITLENSGFGNIHLLTSNNPSLTINSLGNIGIGTTTPSAELQFSNTIANKKIVLNSIANTSDHQFYGLGINASTLRYQTDATTADHVFYAATSATTSNELLRIKGNGNIGVGTSTPTTKLEVNGFTKLGSDAPAIKTKKITGVTASSDGGLVFYTTGIDQLKILSVSVSVLIGNVGNYNTIFENTTTLSGSQFQYYIGTSGDVAIRNISGNSSNILSKPVKIFITYEE